MKQNKTNTQNTNTNATAPAQPEAKKSKGRFFRPYVNLKLRDERRLLPPDAVIALLREHAPELYNLAEIVGEWVWITFETEPAEKVRTQLSQFGFHWNNARKCWQHPCGKITERGAVDPRQKYGSRFAADLQAA